ncbi:MAG TPA: hypothetical protein VFS82_05975 [Lysobacter sp.]|nr:hypothetical protein [Lysobacter sp.]
MSRRYPNLPLASLLASVLLVAVAWPSIATAAVVRCQLPDGSTLYTDRRCSDLGATLQLSFPDANTGAPTRSRARTGIYRRGCARNLQDLMLRISSAIDNRDTNLLAGVYHWAGMSGRRSKTVMDRLDRVARHPLVGVVPVMAGAASDLSVGDDSSFDPHAGETPVALRIEQTLDNGITPSNTVFGLHRHFGCLWIQG